MTAYKGHRLMGTASETVHASIIYNGQRAFMNVVIGPKNELGKREITSVILIGGFEATEYKVFRGGEEEGWMWWMEERRWWEKGCWRWRICRWPWPVESRLLLHGLEDIV